MVLKKEVTTVSLKNVVSALILKFDILLCSGICPYIMEATLSSNIWSLCYFNYITCAFINLILYNIFFNLIRKFYKMQRLIKTYNNSSGFAISPPSYCAMIMIRLFICYYAMGCYQMIVRFKFQGSRFWLHRLCCGFSFQQLHCHFHTFQLIIFNFMQKFINNLETIIETYWKHITPSPHWLPKSCRICKFKKNRFKY